MIDPDRVLRPLDDEKDAIFQLASYGSSAQLAAALTGSWRAVDRSLRHLLRDDPGAPRDLRLAALSTADVPSDRVISALTRRNLISLRLAGMTHQMEQAARRAEQGDVRAPDGDAALATIGQLQTEVHALTDRPVLDAVHQAVTSRALADVAREVPSSRRKGRSRYRLAATSIAAAGALGLWLLVRDDPMTVAVAEFEAGRHGAAEQGFRQILADDTENVTAMLYLGRIYRRQNRRDEAADVLRKAANLAPQDAAVHRELGYLFLDLNQPRSAAARFRQAMEIDAEEDLNWLGLIRALRAAGDPEADEVLQRAPPEVQAALTSEVLPRDTL